MKLIIELDIEKHESEHEGICDTIGCLARYIHDFGLPPDIMDIPSWNGHGGKHSVGRMWVAESWNNGQAPLDI